MTVSVLRVYQLTDAEAEEYRRLQRAHSTAQDAERRASAELSEHWMKFRPVTSKDEIAESWRVMENPVGDVLVVTESRKKTDI